MRDWLKNVLLQLYEHDSMSPGFLTPKQRFRVRWIHTDKTGILILILRTAYFLQVEVILFLCSSLYYLYPINQSMSESVRKSHSTFGKRKNYIKCMLFIKVHQTVMYSVGEENLWEWEASSCWWSLCWAACAGLWEELQHVHLPSALAVRSTGPTPFWQVPFILLCFQQILIFLSL